MTDPYKQADRARWLRDLLCGALIGAGAVSYTHLRSLTSPLLQRISLSW